MENQLHIPSYVFREYNFQVNRMIPYRGVIKLYTDHGMYALKATKATFNQLEMTYRMMENQTGMPTLLPFELNKYGDPFIADSDGNWYVTTWLEGDHWEIGKPRDGIQLINQMVALHRVGKTLSKDLIVDNAIQKSKILTFWQDQLNQLERYRQSGISTPLLQSIVPYLSFIIQSGWEACHRLQHVEQVISEEIKHNYTYCHGRIHPHNMVIQGNQMWLIDYDHCSYDHPVRDIAVFLRGQMPKFYWDVEIGQDWLLHYDSFHPLLLEEKMYLAALLSFPRRMFRFLLESLQRPVNDHQQWMQQFERLFTDLNCARRFVQSLHKI